MYKNKITETVEIAYLTLFRMEGDQKGPTSFCAVTSTMVEVSPQNFFTFSFNSSLSASLKLLNLDQEQH